MKTPVYRRVVYSLFIIFFLITAPLVVLYTMGYRYNFSRGRVQKTGIIRITSIPRSAEIYLNNELYKKSKTPAKIEKVLPGDYQIRLSRDGYFDWEKKLAVYENTSTFAERIILWKKTEPEKLDSSEVGSWLISPDKNSIVFINEKGVISSININSGIFGELSGGKIEPIINLKLKNLTIESFSPSGRYLLINNQENDKNNYLLVDLLLKESKKIDTKNSNIIKFDNNSDTLYFYANKDFWQITYNSSEAESLFKRMEIKDFFVNNKDLYTISNQTLIQKDLMGNTYREIKKLDCQDCKIKDIKNNRIFIFDKNREKLLVIDLNNQIKDIEMQARKIDWLNSRSLIGYNNFEIQILELKKNEPEIITRGSSMINSAIWHPSGRHLFFSDNNSIKIIELDNREFRNILDITNIGADNISLDRAGKNIFFSNSEGVFKLNIR